jgi:hypothetical protein
MLSFLPATAMTIPIGAAGSRADASVAAAANAVFSIRIDGVEVGTITFALGSAVGVFVLAAAQTVLTTQKLTVIAPTPADTALSNVGFTIAATR